MDGQIIGVFGADKDVKARFLGAIAKKSEVEGMIVYHRGEAGKRLSFLDDPQYPEKVQGYSRIASLSDYAFSLYPPTGRLSGLDGELAVLIESFQLPGRVVVVGGTAGPTEVKASFRGLRMADYPVEQRNPESSLLDMTGIKPPERGPNGTLIYVDRAFSVKGVGTVVLGFVISGSVSVHDKLRAIPSSPEKTVEVKGIQVNDEDQETVGRGLRVGLSLRGVDAKELEKTCWLDDGASKVTQSMGFRFDKSPYYKQPVEGRELHVQLPGEMVLAKVTREGETYFAELPFSVPLWDGMRLAVIDLNGKGLRVAGGGAVLPIPV